MDVEMVKNKRLFYGILIIAVLSILGVPFLLSRDSATQLPEEIV